MSSFSTPFLCEESFFLWQAKIFVLWTLRVERIIEFLEQFSVLQAIFGSLFDLVLPCMSQ